MYGRALFCDEEWWVAWTEQGLRASAHGTVDEGVFADRLRRCQLEPEPAAPSLSAPSKIDPAALPSGFSGRVIDACRRIPSGQVRSYAELAAEAGSPRAARAVGSAMAANPLPGVIPCHRVVRSDGRIGAYSAGGPDRKRELLAREGVASSPSGVIEHA